MTTDESGNEIDQLGIHDPVLQYLYRYEDHITEMEVMPMFFGVIAMIPLWDLAEWFDDWDQRTGLGKATSVIGFVPIAVLSVVSYLLGLVTVVGVILVVVPRAKITMWYKRRAFKNA